MTFPKFEYYEPKTLEAALSLLAEKREGTHVVAGGTDLLVKMNHGLLKPKAIIAIKGIQGLHQIRFHAKKGLTIGATALLAEVASHRDIRRHYPAVAYAAQETANVQIRNMGTVAGNLCNAAPSADNAPTLMAMGAEVTLVSLKGERRLPLDQFFKGPGLTAMEPGEMMTSIFVPLPPPRAGTSYKHLSARGKVDISGVCVGVMVTLNGAGLQGGQDRPRCRRTHAHAGHKGRGVLAGSALDKRARRKGRGYGGQSIEAHLGCQGECRIPEKNGVRADPKGT